jgi:hypothetical protein
MHKILLWLSLFSSMTLSTSAYTSVYSQIQPTPMANISAPAASVSVSSSLSVPVDNQTIKANEGTLRSGILGFLNSAPNILKTSSSFQPLTKTKITNEINNTTQIVEGADATNAIVGVELGRALRTVVDSSDTQDGGGPVVVTTSSSCTPIAGPLTCNNTVVIK